jgi:hypothetical protein
MRGTRAGASSSLVARGRVACLDPDAKPASPGHTSVSFQDANPVPDLGLTGSPDD